VHGYANGSTSLERVSASAQGWANHARYGNTVGLRRAVLGSVTIPTNAGHSISARDDSPGRFQ
jgi:hypothetical protein